MTQLSRKHWILLILLTLCWGINWPVMKIGVHDFPPLSFRALCMLGGLPAIWLAARWQRIPLTIPPGATGALLRLAIPNMMIWHVLMILAVKMLSSGRAAILGYTMPVWAALFGVLLFGERLSRGAWFGIACAFSGALLLLSSEFGKLAGNPSGSVFALIAAAAWGYGTIAMRRSTLTMPTTALTFWMLAMATTGVALAAILFEHDDWIMPDPMTWGAIVFNALVIFGFAHVVWFMLARSLPPVASSLSVMMIPVLGVFSGAWLLGETPHWQDYAAMLLILAAMSSVLLKRGGGAHK
jgi:drug/metabolite transporter (DMT)-like permease